MAQVPTGTTFYLVSAFASPKTTTIVTNATEAVVTSAAHGYANGDFVLVSSGWGRLNNRAFRIKSVTTDTFVLEGMDTSSTTYFPAGSGVGTVSKFTTLAQLTQVLAINSSGGDPINVEYKYLESDVKYSMNDGFSATNSSLDLDADAIGTAGYTAAKSLTTVQTVTVMKTVTRSGSIILQPCTVALNESVKMQDGQINRITVAFNGQNVLTRYAF
jgi:hypothetical protein